MFYNFQLNDHRFDDYEVEDVDFEDLILSETPKFSDSNFFSDLSTMTQRTWVDSLRNAYVHRARFLQKLFVATFIALIFSWIDMTKPNQQTVQSVQVRLLAIISRCALVRNPGEGY